jgi:hypothetical protein
MSQYYTWNNSRKVFCKTKQGTRVPGYDDIRETDALGRAYIIHPNNAECYFLRMLLHVRRGPTSFASLKIVEGEECQTFREACQKLGLLENDQDSDVTMSEASVSCFPAQLRALFAIILTTCAPSNPKTLWEKYKESLSEDVLRQERRENPSMDLNFSTDIYNQALNLLEDRSISMNGKTLSELGLEAPTRSDFLSYIETFHERKATTLLSWKHSYEITSLFLLEDQRQAYNRFMISIEIGNGIFFLDARGGTGKIFLFNLCLLIFDCKMKSPLLLHHPEYQQHCWKMVKVLFCS